MKRKTTHWDSGAGLVHLHQRRQRWHSCRPPRAGGITSKIEEVGCWHCRRYIMNPNNWNPGKQPNYPKQWDIDLKAKKEKAQ